MKKRMLSLLLVVMLLSSSLAMADGKAGIKDVLFPNYLKNFESIRKEVIGDDHYERFKIVPNGPELDGSAVTEWPGNTAASWDVYEMTLVEEGLVSIIAEPKSYNSKSGSLNLDIYYNDNRSGKIIVARDAWNVLEHKKSDGWSILDRFSFYGYPGTYYIVVDGKSSDKNGKYYPIDYKIKVIQDSKVARTSGFTPDISYDRKNGGTQYFGTVLLDGVISISDSLNLSTWSYKAKNSNYATEKTIKDVLYYSGVRKNSFDRVYIKTKVDGVVQMSVISDAEKVVGEQNCQAMDICSETWLERLMSTTSDSAKTKYAQRIAENRFSNISVGGFPGGGSKNFNNLQSGEIVSFEAKANTIYSIYISSFSARPIYYKLKIAGPGHSVDEVSSPAMAQPPVAVSQPATTPTETVGQTPQTAPATETTSASGAPSLNDFQFTQAPLYDGVVANEACGIMLYGGKFTNGRIKGNRRDGNCIETSPMVFYNKKIKYAFTPYGNRYMSIDAGIDGVYTYHPVYSLDHSWNKSLVLKPGEKVYVDLTFSAAGMTNYACTGNYYGEPGAKVIYENSAPANSNLLEKTKQAHSFYIRFCDNYDNENNKVCLNDLKITSLQGQPAVPPNTAQGAPIIAEAFDNGNLIRWQPVKNAIGYRPFRSEYPNELGISVTDFYLEQTEHVDVNVEPNVTYYYCVKPVLAEADPLNDKDEVLGNTIATYTVKTSANIVDAGKSKQYIKLKIDDPNMDVNGVISEVDPGRGTTPLIVRGRTVVPIRAIVEAMDGTIAWDGTARKVTIKARGNSVEMWLDKKEIAANGAKQAIDVAPESINGRTMVPIRFATENLDCKISWINSTRQVIIVYTDK